MESLGYKLKTAREDRGFSLNDVCENTNISTRYLEALEREDFSVFPGEPYALGFLKNYGEYLGISSEELLFLYRSLKIRDQPIPMAELLNKSMRFPKILGKIAIVLVILAALAGGAYYIYRLPPRLPPAAPAVIRTAAEYVLTTDFIERRFYPGDSILVSDGRDSYKLLFASISDALTITTPRDSVKLDLGQEVTVDLNNDGFAELRIIAADFVKNDSASGALLRIEQETPPQTARGTSDDMPPEITAARREESLILFSSNNAFPFTLQAQFQGYCLFRYEVLFERDRPGRTEQFYQRSEEVSIYALNGIRFGVSNARAVKLQVMGGGRVVPFEAGSPGEVIAADLRWIRDSDNRLHLVLLRLE